MTECWSEEAKNGTKILYLKRDEYVWRLNSNYAPEKEAARWAEQYQISDINTPICMFGLGNGYFLQALLEIVREDTIILVIEPDKKVYEQIKDEYGLERILKDSRVHFFAGIERDVISNLCYQSIDWRNNHSVIYSVHPHYDEIYQEEYLTYLKVIRDFQINQESAKATSVFHGTKRAENLLEALRLLPDEFVLKKLPLDLAAQIPVIIIAAGPSLNQNMETLKKAKGKALLLAVDRIVPVLQEYGIRPDLKITIDPVKESEFLGETDDVPLLCGFASNKESMRKHKKHLIFYGMFGYIKKLFEAAGRETSIMNTGGSVATAAFAVCKTLQVKNIILVGQDLAYKDGQTHAAGQKSEKQMPHYKVEDIYGNLIETRMDWYMFLRWFEQEIRQSPELHVIDATEGGAKIQGTEVRTLSEVLEELPSMPFTAGQIIESLQEKISLREYQCMIERLQTDILDLEQIERQTGMALEMTEKLIKACRNKSIDKPEYNKPIQKLHEINIKLREYEVLSFLEYYTGGEEKEKLENIYKMSENDIKNKENTYKRAKQFYEMYQKNSRKLSEEMRQIFTEK